MEVSYSIKKLTGSFALTQWRGNGGSIGLSPINVMESAAPSLGRDAPQLSAAEEDAAAAKVLGHAEHFYAIYELGGPAMLSCEDKARVLTDVLGHPVRAVQDKLEDFRAKAKVSGMPAHIIETRARMFDHYDTNGLAGNGNVLRWLLGRAPNAFDVYVRRELLPLKSK